MNLYMQTFPLSISFMIFERDLRRISEYFIRQGVEVDYHDLAKKLWQTYNYRQMPEIDLNMLDEEDEQDRVYWQRIKDDN